MIDQIYNFLVNTCKRLSDEIKNTYNNTKEDQTIIRYFNGQYKTISKEIDSKFIGFLSVSKDLYESRNLVKHSGFNQSFTPYFNETNSTINTTVEDGFKCTMVQTSITGSGSTGIYYNNSDLYTKFENDDDIVISFLIKGSVSSWSTFGFDYAIETGVVNKKTYYPDWERVIWYGKHLVLDGDSIGAFRMSSPVTSTQYTYFIREFCAQKASKFTGYSVAPDDIINDTSKYTWTLIDVKQSDWNAVDDESISFIRNKPSSLPASDVSDWAKQITKPSYNYDEIAKKPVNVTITIDEFGWSENLPYTKTISVPGIKATDEPIIFPYTPHDVSGSAIDTTRQMASYITDADTADGELILYCGKTKPTSSFDILVVGISSL